MSETQASLAERVRAQECYACQIQHNEVGVCTCEDGKTRREAATELERLEEIVNGQDDHTAELERIVAKLPDPRGATIARTGMQVTIDCSTYADVTAWMHWLMEPAAQAATESAARGDGGVKNIGKDGRWKDGTYGCSA